MAEKKRSQSLQEQLDRLLEQAPKPYSAEEITQINKGRGKTGTAQQRQAEIDEGRATIERRNEEVRKFQGQIDKLNEQIGKAIEFERGAAKEDKEGGIKDKERAEKESVWGRAVQLAVGAPAVKLGYAIGDRMGEGFNERADKGQTARNTVLRQIADDRVKGLTTREGALAGARRSGVLSSKNPIARVVPRGAAQLAGGVGALGLGIYDLATMNPDDPWLTSALRAGLGGAATGAGAGIGVKALERMANPRVIADGAALSIIESPQLRRAGLNQAREIDKGPISPAPDDGRALPAPSGPAPGSKDHLREQAKALGAKVTTRMTKEELAKAIATKATEAGAKRVRAPKLPKGTGAAGIAGGLAYAMTPDGAQAADGSQGSNQGQALTNAGIAGGAAYGASRGISRLPPIVGKGLGAAGTAMSLYDEFSAASRGEDADRDTMQSPMWQDTMAAMDIEAQHPGMAQVPSRNPARPTSGMFEQGGDPEFEAALQAFLQEYEADNGSPEGTMAEAY